MTTTTLIDVNECIDVPIGATEIPIVAFGWTRAVDSAYDPESYIKSGDTLTGTPTVVDDDATGDLTIASVQKNTAQETLANGDTVAIDHGVLFTVSSSTTSKKRYNLLVSCATTDGRTLKRKFGVCFK